MDNAKQTLQMKPLLYSPSQKSHRLCKPGTPQKLSCRPSMWDTAHAAQAHAAVQQKYLQIMKTKPQNPWIQNYSSTKWLCKWRLHNLAANQREPRVALLLALTKALTSISLPTIFIPISSILLKLVISGAYEGETSTLLVPRNSYWKTYILIFLKPEENLQMHQEF